MLIVVSLALFVDLFASSTSILSVLSLPPFSIFNCWAVLFIMHALCLPYLTNMRQSPLFTAHVHALFCFFFFFLALCSERKGANGQDGRAHVGPPWEDGFKRGSQSQSSMMDVKGIKGVWGGGAEEEKKTVLH